MPYFVVTMLITMERSTWFVDKRETRKMHACSDSYSVPTLIPFLACYDVVAAGRVF